MTESKLDLKGVIQVDDGDGWRKGTKVSPGPDKKRHDHNSVEIFKPIMDAIKSIRAEYPDHYIGLTYGANAGQNSKFFTQYGFPNSASLRVAKEIDPTTTIDTVNILTMLNFMAGGSGQAEVLSSDDVINMFKNEFITNKFIIIPFDTMESNVDEAGKGKLDEYGHKTDCLAFATKFLKLPKSIIIGWRNGRSTLDKLTDTKPRQALVPGMDKLYFALGGGAASGGKPVDLNRTTAEYIDFLIDNWDSESQKFIEKIASGPKLDEKLDDTGTDGADATEKKPTGVTAEQIKELQDQLLTHATLADGEKKTAYGIAQDIFKVFFSSDGDKSKQKKDFLTSQVTALKGLTIFSNESKAELDEILENPAIAKKKEVEEVKDDADKKVKDDADGAKTKDEVEKAAAAAAAAADAKKKEEAEKAAEKKRKDDAAAADAKKKEEAEKAAEKKRKDDADAAAAAAGNLSVMTFNTWYLSFNASKSNTESATFCDDGGKNKCSDNNRRAILAQMAKPGPVLIFLQEFTYNFDTFFQGDGRDGIIIKDVFRSKVMAMGSNKKPTSIPAFRYFTMTYKANKFHVYIGQIGDSVIATIYSTGLYDDPADAFFVGNLAAGTLNSGKLNDPDPKSYDLAYTFSGNDTSVTQEIPWHHSKGTYAFGGNRPFIILKINAGLLLMNIHAPHDDTFRSGIPTGNIDDFGFNALERFIPATVFKGSTMDKHTFIVGGDFNADAAKSIGRLNNIFKDNNANATMRKGNTCCTTGGGLSFTRQVDHIFSTLKFSNYNVYDPKDLEKTKSSPRYFFSDHLPVYATIPKPEEEPAAAPGAPAGASASSWLSSSSSSSKPASDAPVVAEAEAVSSSSSDATRTTPSASKAATPIVRSEPIIAAAATTAATTPPVQQDKLHDLVFGFNVSCDDTLILGDQPGHIQHLIEDIQKNPNAYSLTRGHTFLYSAFRGTGNVCLINFMRNPHWNNERSPFKNRPKPICDIMQPNNPMPKWVSNGKRNTESLDDNNLLETTLIDKFVKNITTAPVNVNSHGRFELVFDPSNITTSGTQVVHVDSAGGTKTDIVVSRDITTGNWTWFMDDEQFNYTDEISAILEKEFKNNNGNGFCKFVSKPIISSPGQPTVNLIQVRFSTIAVVREINVEKIKSDPNHTTQTHIRICDTSYPFHGAIERLRTADNLQHAIDHGKNIRDLTELFRHDNMDIIKTLRNDIFYINGGTKHAFTAIDELLFARTELLRRFASEKSKNELTSILDQLVNTFSILSKDADEIIGGKPLTPCTNIKVLDGDNGIEIIINSQTVKISIGSFIEFDRWVISYNPGLTISSVKTRAIVERFGGTPSDKNRIFYWPWRETENRWTTSSYSRAIGLTSGYLNEYWDTIKIIKCPSTDQALCTIAAISKWQREQQAVKPPQSSATTSAAEPKVDDAVYAGWYITKNNNTIGFMVYYRGSNIYEVSLDGRSGSLQEALGFGGGYYFPISSNEFIDFKQNIINNKASSSIWTVSINGTVKTVPGKWVDAHSPSSGQQQRVSVFKSSMPTAYNKGFVSKITKQLNKLLLEPEESSTYGWIPYYVDKNDTKNIETMATKEYDTFAEVSAINIKCHNAGIRVSDYGVTRETRDKPSDTQKFRVWVIPELVDVDKENARLEKEKHDLKAGIDAEASIQYYREQLRNEKLPSTYYKGYRTYIEERFPLYNDTDTIELMTISLARHRAARIIEGLEKDEAYNTVLNKLDEMIKISLEKQNESIIANLRLKFGNGTPKSGSDGAIIGYDLPDRFSDKDAAESAKEMIISKLVLSSELSEKIRRKIYVGRTYKGGGYVNEWYITIIDPIGILAKIDSVAASTAPAVDLMTVDKFCNLVYKPTADSDIIAELTNGTLKNFKLSNTYVTQKVGKGNTPLYCACRSPKTTLRSIEQLVTTLGLKVNIPNETNKSTPLHGLVERLKTADPAQVEIIIAIMRFLISNGASTDSKNAVKNKDGNQLNLTALNEFNMFKLDKGEGTQITPDQRSLIINLLTPTGVSAAAATSAAASSAAATSATAVPATTELKKLIEDLRVGNFSKYQTTQGPGENIPFDKKPAQQFLKGLGVASGEGAALSSMDGGKPIPSGSSQVVVNSFDPAKTSALTITGERIDTLIKSAKTYVNTSIISKKEFTDIVGQNLKSLPSKMYGKIHIQNLAAGVCHSQKIDLLAQPEIPTFGEYKGKVILAPKNGNITKDMNAILLLSSPALNFAYGSKPGSFLSSDEQIRYLEGMYRNLFNAAVAEKYEYIALPAAGLGVFAGDKIEEIRKMYFGILTRISKEFPNLNIIYNSGHPTNAADFDAIFEKEPSANLVRTNQDVMIVAHTLTQKGKPCAFHNPSDADVVFGIYDVGEYWKNGKGDGYVGEEHIGAMTTAPLNSRLLNPAAYSTSVVEYNPVGKFIWKYKHNDQWIPFSLNVQTCIGENINQGGHNHEKSHNWSCDDGGITYGFNIAISGEKTVTFNGNMYKIEKNKEN